MSADSRARSTKDTLISYLEYLSHYEKDLYLDSTPDFSALDAKQAASHTENSISGSLDPYPAHAPYKSLAEMESSIKGCLRCPLGSSRNKFVYGGGSSEAKVVFIGEAPGAEEDKRGIPFIGRAGKLLDHMLSEIGWSRDEVYICNILKCRPPNNRDPQPEEIAECELFLHEQLRILNPQILVALGRVSAQTLLRTKAPLRDLRSRLHKYQDKPFWVTYHPAALLRNQNLMPTAQQDLITLKKMVEEGITEPDSLI